jgi:glycosyltransferase involved in cell wall biosynthesis
VGKHNLKGRKMKLSVIVPFVNEYPQVMFTIHSIAQDLMGRVDFEIIAINNYCKQVKREGRPEDKGAEAVKAGSGRFPWLKYLHYDKKLSHWQAKNMGVAHSTGDILWFCDSHCCVGRDLLYDMFQYYTSTSLHETGSLHAPLSYKILESSRLIYKLNDDSDKGWVWYSFTGCQHNEGMPYEVPCMSTCGMMLSRRIYDDLGGWPEIMGIYGGGENFMNYTLAILGYKKWIFPGSVKNDYYPALHHHGEKRGYSQNYDDTLRNRMAAMYCVGGKDFATLFSNQHKGKPEVKATLLNQVLDQVKDQRAMIKSKQKMTIQEWLKKWKK